MYQINKEENRIYKISKKTFGELGLKEREHLQEWIAHNPEVFWEDLLVIQKKFAKFDDTKENIREIYQEYLDKYFHGQYAKDNLTTLQRQAA